MEVPGLGKVPKIAGVYNKDMGVKRSERTSGVASKKDFLSISGPAKDFQTVMKALKEVPSIRQDKVIDLSEKYEAGNYEIDGRDTAEKIMNSMVGKRI